MNGWFDNLNGLEIFYLICAIGGLVPLIVIFIMRLFGSHADGSGDLGDGHFDVSDIDSSADISFNFLSLQGLTTFLMMFGFVGLALSKASGLTPYISISGGVVAGLLSVWLIASLYTLINKFQSSGTQRLSDAVGSEGEVYLRIPEKGTGKVMINFQNHLREFDAVSKSGEALVTGDRIRVTGVSSTTMIVEKIQ